MVACGYNLDLVHSLWRGESGLMRSPEERELIEAARNGDAEAFRRLYEANVDAVFRYAVARVGRQDAEDVTAETFSRAWRGLPSFEHQGRPFVAWLYRIALNIIISQARRMASSLLVQNQQSTSPEFEDSLVDAIDSTRIRTAVSELPERQRLVLELRVARELSVAEVAELLEITDEAVRSLTYRALTALRSRHSKEGSLRR